jgi:ribonuclease HII
MEYLDINDELLNQERLYWGRGFSFIAGIDEVGRGPLAGPVVAAAVVFPRGSIIPAVNDSKKLKESEREELFDLILAVKEVQYAIAVIDAPEIDKINILRATHTAMRQAVEQLKYVDFLLVDGLPVPGLPVESKAIVKGDSKSASIAAASIIAKVYRDRMMTEYAKNYPEYGFEQHKGYGTAMHMAAIAKYGICPLHRRSFAPVRDILIPPPEQLNLL